jgi:lipoprotein-releasing system permease protein
MNIEHFIAQRIAFSKQKSFTKIIIRIAIAAIAISLSVMILTSALIDGFKLEISEKIFGFWGHIHATDTNINRNFELSPIDQTDTSFILIRGIKSISYERPRTVLGMNLGNQSQTVDTYGGVKKVQPYIIMPALMSTKTLFHGVLLKGLDQTYDWTSLQLFMVEGRILSFPQDTNAILISKNIADKLEAKVGQKVILTFIKDKSQMKKRFEIRGIYNTGLEEYDKRFCIVSMSMLQGLLGWQANEVQGMEIVLDDVRDLDAIAEHVYYEKLPQTYNAETIKQKFPSIFEWLNLQDINEKIILALMIVVAIINMMTVLLILILERSRMIGILKSLGMSNNNVRKIFIFNAAYILLYGLLWGNIIGLGIAFAQKYFKFIKLDEASYYLDTAPIDVHWDTVIWLNLGVLLCTLIFLIVPTWLVTRITPVKVLRFE